MSNPIRDAIGAALDHPFADEAFALVDLIEANVLDGEPTPESTRHEVAAEIADQIVSILSTRQAANLWAILGANDAAAEDFGPSNGSTLDRIVSDLFVVVERAVFDALTTRYDEES